MTPLTPEMIERAARAIHDLMGPYLGTPEQIAKHGDRVAARQLETAEKYATVALTAALSCPDGFRLVPVEPTAEMVRCGEDARYWAKSQAHEAYGADGYSLAPLRRRGGYEANVWVNA